MLVSIWWVLVAFILGGTGGVLVLALFSAAPRDEDVADLERSFERSGRPRPFNRIVPVS